jgi:hypothetical protein
VMKMRCHSPVVSLQSKIMHPLRVDLSRNLVSKIESCHTSKLIFLFHHTVAPGILDCIHCFIPIFSFILLIISLFLGEPGVVTAAAKEL